MPRILNKTVWPHQVTMDYLGKKTDPKVKWLEEKVKPDDWYLVAGIVSGTYCFKDEKDYLHFLLVWQ